MHHSDDDVGANSRETTPPCLENQQSTEAIKQLHSTNSSPVFAAKADVTAELPIPNGASADLALASDKVVIDKHCYECKVHYRDPKPKDLVMYLHAWKYKVCKDRV